MVLLNGVRVGSIYTYSRCSRCQSGMQKKAHKPVVQSLDHHRRTCHCLPCCSRGARTCQSTTGAEVPGEALVMAMVAVGLGGLLAREVAERAAAAAGAAAARAAAAREVATEVAARAKAKAGSNHCQSPRLPRSSPCQSPRLPPDSARRANYHPLAPFACRTLMGVMTTRMGQGSPTPMAMKLAALFLVAASVPELPRAEAHAYVRFFLCPAVGMRTSTARGTRRARPAVSATRCSHASEHSRCRCGA